MKNSKEYSEKLTSYLGALKKAPAAAKMPTFADPLESMVYAMICEYTTEANAARVYKRICSHFVDFNDLRVSRVEEVLDVMDDSGPEAQRAAAMMTKVLNHVYERYDRMSLDALKESGKRQGRKELEELEGVSRFAVDFCFVTALEGHAVPLKENMKVLLKAEGLIHPESTDDEIRGFLERQVSAADGWAFYTYLCGQCEGVDSGEARAKSARRKATAKKADAASKKTTKRTSKK